MDEIEIPGERQIQIPARVAAQTISQHGVLDATYDKVPNLRDYYHIISKRRWAVLSCLIIVFATVAIGTLEQKNVYQGRVLIEIGPQQPDVLTLHPNLQINSSDVDMFDYYLETQLRVLRSRPLAERVVQDLELYRNPEFYRARSFFGLRKKSPKKIPGPSDGGSPVFSTDAYRNSVKSLLSSLQVDPVGRSNLVELSVDSEDPKLAARIANELASDYIEQNLQVKWDATIKAADWLKNQLVDLKAKLEKSEDALQDYAQRNSILFVEEKQNLVNARLKQIQEEYTKAQAERFQKESMYRLVQAGKVQDLPGFLSNRLIQDLAVRLAELDRDYSQLITTFKPDYPKAIALKKQIDTLQASLDRQKQALGQNIVDEYRSAVANEKLLTEALEHQKKEVNEIAEKSIQYSILKREVDTNRQLYEGLLQRLREAQVSAGLKASNIHVVEPADVPMAPVKPRIFLSFALGLILGLGLGIGLAFFQEYLDNTVKTSDELEALLALPSLGHIPTFSLNGAGKSAGELVVSGAMSEQTPVVPAVQNDPAVIEAFLTLGTSIILSPDPVPKLLLITSALPEEGKTVTTLNLGAALASLGNKVVIVDCDMRRPALHRLFGMKSAPGFVKCLTGCVKLESATLPVPQMTNLSIIPCGPVPPNPARFFSSPQAGKLLRALRSEFDFVLMDSPPLLSVADGRILSAISDGVVLVVRAYRTPYPAVRQARSLLDSAGARTFGVVLNSVASRQDGYDYYYSNGHTKKTG